eukprot:c18954_g1_i1 orf=392-799(-)
MASLSASSIKPGTIVHLYELQPGSPFFQPTTSLRVMGLLQNYQVDSGIAVISEGGASLKIDTQHIRNLQFSIGSLYQFIGELSFPAGDTPDQMILQARVGRNVDGLDVKLYDKALQLRRQFEAKYMQHLKSQDTV